MISMKKVGLLSRTYTTDFVMMIILMPSNVNLFVHS